MFSYNQILNLYINITILDKFNTSIISIHYDMHSFLTYPKIITSIQQQQIKQNLLQFPKIIKQIYTQFALCQLILFIINKNIVQQQITITKSKTMSSNRNNRLLPIKNHMHSQQNSRQSSQQKIPLHQSLTKYSKTNPFPNPYYKKFNLRKINRTQQSVKKKSIKIQQPKLEFEGDTEIIHKINQSLQLKKDKKFNSIRIHTQKLRNKTNDILKDSPYIPQNNYTYNASLNKNNQQNNNSNMQTIDHQQIQNQTKYQHLTSFQRQEIHRYQVYFVGKRRISNIKDFTDKNNDVKVAAHDSIIYRYEVLDILGKGSFGQVFKVLDHKRKQLCALKIIRNQPKFCTQAKVQIKILQHVLIKDTKMKSNIIQLKHAFFFRGHPCLVFQLLHQNLYQFLRQFKFQGISLDLILRFTIQILQGLLFLRKYNIIHCDLKPENILLKQLNKTGIKIIDLGSGCYEQQQIYTYIQSRFYRAPEIVFGIPYTPAIDMWSLGCIIVELYQGYPLFPGQDQNQQIAMIMQVLGVPKPSFIQKGCRTKKFFTQNQPKIKPNKKGMLRKPGSKILSQILNCDNADFLDFLIKILLWQPQKRMTPAQALIHPWILKSLPQQIRKQHMLHVQKNNEI